jgi:hypothetical protein
MEKHYSLAAAAAMVGVDRKTLRRWLVEMGFVLPDNPRRGIVLVRETDLNAVVRKHSVQSNFAAMRKASNFAAMRKAS